MAKEPNNARVLVLLPKSLRRQVNKLARQEETSIAEVGRKAIKRYVEESCTTPTP